MANLIPARYAQTTIQLFQLPKADIAPLIEQQSLPLSLLETEPLEGTLDAEQYGRLFIAILQQAQRTRDSSKDEAEDVVNLSTYRLLYSYMLQAPNLGDALNRAAAYYARFQEQREGFTLTTEDDLTTWQFNLSKVENGDLTTATDQDFSMDNLQWLPGFSGRIAALYTWHRLASWMAGNFIDLSSLHIDYARLGQAEDYIASFRAPVYFNQKYCQLKFHKRYLALPIVRNETDLNKMLETFPAELMRADAMIDSMAAKVSSLLGNDFSGEMPSLEAMANRLNTTTTTLHRRLKNEGTSYQLIKDGCRRDAAIQLLRIKKQTGSEIAEKLGFSDASTFFRAFKKWTGTTPQEFIKQEV